MAPARSVSTASSSMSTRRGRPSSAAAFRAGYTLRRGRAVVPHLRHDARQPAAAVGGRARYHACSRCARSTSTRTAPAPASTNSRSTTSASRRRCGSSICPTATSTVSRPSPSCQLKAVSLNGSVFVGRDTRPDSGFGLLTNDSNGFSLGADYVPDTAVSLGASYEFEKYKTLQKSRQADPGPQFEDPTRDWTTTGRDSAHTFLASADLLKLWPKTDVRFAYDFVHAESSYIYGLTADTTLPPGRAAAGHLQQTEPSHRRRPLHAQRARWPRTGVLVREVHASTTSPSTRRR